MLSEALLKLGGLPVEVEERFDKDVFRKEFEEYLEKIGGFWGNTWGKIAAGLGIGIPLAGLGVAGIEAGLYMRRKGKMVENKESVLRHLKELYPAAEHRHVEEAYSAIAHVAPDIAQNPLIARTLVKNMMTQMVRPDMKQHGYAQTDISQIQQIGKMEESLSKARPQGGVLDLVGQRAKTMADIGKTYETLGGGKSAGKPGINIAHADINLTRRR